MYRYWITLTIVCLLALLAYWYHPDAAITLSDPVLRLPTLLVTVAVLSLFVERSVEVVLSALRSGGADQLDLALAHTPKDTDDYRALLYERADYRAHSRLIAQQLALTFGLLIALVGVRILAGLVADVPAGWQDRLFHMVDILLTGSVIAGGSEAANKLTKAYSQLMRNLARRGADEGRN